jgi:hypothetical protein
MEVRRKETMMLQITRRIQIRMSKLLSADLVQPLSNEPGTTGRHQIAIQGYQRVMANNCRRQWLLLGKRENIRKVENIASQLQPLYLLQVEGQEVEVRCST